MSDFNESEYKKEYDRKNYKKITFRVRKDEAEAMANFIKEKTDLSMNEFIKRAVYEKIESIQQED